MGIRLRIWAIAAAGMAALALALLWGGGAKRGPEARVAVAERAAAVTAGTRDVESATQPRPASGGPGRLGSAASPVPARVRAAGRSPGAAGVSGSALPGAGAPPQSRPVAPAERRFAAAGGGAARRGAAPPPDPRATERDAAQLARALDLPVDETAAVLDPDDFNSVEDLETAAAANAVILEYRMLLERMAGLPSDYPVEARRAAVVEEIANLSPAQRERQLRESKDYLARLRSYGYE